MATFTVTSLADNGAGSLREAIASANSTPGADEIVFQSGLSGNIITLDSTPLFITESLIITGPGASVLTIDGNDNSRIFDITDSSGGAIANAVTISGLTLTGGNGSDGEGSFSDGGAISSQDTALTIQNSVITGNSSSNSGGGIFFYSYDDTLTIQNSTVSYNYASNGGGGIFISKGNLVIQSSSISDNETGEGSGGGIATRTGSSGEGGVGDILIEGSTITGNTSSGAGGGISFADAQAITIINSTIADNTAVLGNGGGIKLYYANSLTIQNTTISGNEATGMRERRTIGGNGGGIAVGGGSAVAVNVLIEDSAITGNNADFNGGGLYFYYNTGTTTIRRTTIAGNSTDFMAGGGTFVRNTDILIENSEVTGNTAKSGGGGILASSTNLRIENSEVTGNTTEDGGGGILASSTNLDIENSKVGDNTAAYGGGLFLYDATLNLTNSEVTGNTAAFGGGIYLVSTFNTSSNTYYGTNTVNIESSVLANNTPDDLDKSSDDNEFNVTNSLIETGADEINGTDEGNITGEDPNTVTLAVATAITPEGGDPLVFTFTRTGSTDRAITVNFAVSGTATLTDDYTQSGATTFTNTGGTLAFDIGVDTLVISLTPLTDTVEESSETVVLELTNGLYLKGTTELVTGNIANNPVPTPAPEPTPTPTAAPTTAPAPTVPAPAPAPTPTPVPTGPITGTSGRDILTGTDGDDVIFGLGGNDRISGGDGDDIIVGGTGINIVQGGDGADIFVLETGPGGLWIKDFDLSADKFGIPKGGDIRLGAIERQDFRGGTLLVLGNDSLAFVEGIGPNEFRRRNVTNIDVESLG
jgi:hypothetical protein